MPVVKLQQNSAKILDAWREGKREVIVSTLIITELRRVLFYDRVRKYSYMTTQEVYELINNLERGGIQTPALLEIDVIQTDPTDNKWIVAAVEGNADYIVSGDEHLKRLGSYQGIPIVTPVQFLKCLQCLHCLHCLQCAVLVGDLNSTPKQDFKLSIAYNWQFLSAPYGGSFLAHNCENFGGERFINFVVILIIGRK
ncbi:MAG: putative toxin-antitoxin system toxin component, PIN family [Candidatus Poribacteria bacterium]